MDIEGGRGRAGKESLHLSLAAGFVGPLQHRRILQGIGSRVTIEEVVPGHAIAAQINAKAAVVVNDVVVQSVPVTAEDGDASAIETGDVQGVDGAADRCDGDT